MTVIPQQDLRREAVAFAPSDFDVFTIPGLEPRMEALIARVRPKLTALGEALAPDLSALAGEEMFPHVAKHARRTVHAPNDTWVAWAANKRGYKMLPHFQFGMFASHAFAQFAIIYESDKKTVFAQALERDLKKIKKLVPSSYVWSMDHMKPEGTPHREMTDDAFRRMAAKLAGTKQSEVLVGIRFDRDDPLLSDGPALYEKILGTYETLMPLYRMSF
ncbi:DUF1054 domain-containing protein [Paenibacillus antri]|uniref:DUF1054 domain-containing protein n=1 Tax=Paenibacillus antri TaxID=2582848 RepID=UPI001EE41374|nr:DUF1054 domain-containing protein [Paenibacillus antri]